MKCELCKLVEDISKEIDKSYYYQDDLIVIKDCRTCGIPMIVIKRHDKDPTPEELERAELVMKKLFGEKARFRGIGMRSIRQHYHEHILR